MNVFPYNINCDLGEEKNVESSIMPLIQSANIACGAHAGNDQLIAQCIELAEKHRVKIGIHPSYPDRINFGREVLDISLEELCNSLMNQIDNFVTIASSKNAKIHHLKLHGALYNQVAQDVTLANVIADFLDDYPKEWIVFCPPNSVFESILKNKERLVWREAFLDRAYNNDGSLVSRKIDGAVLHSKEKVFNQFKSLVNKRSVKTISGESLKLLAETFCIHGDHENSINILNHIKDQYQNGQL